MTLGTKWAIFDVVIWLLVAALNVLNYRAHRRHARRMSRITGIVEEEIERMKNARH